MRWLYEKDGSKIDVKRRGKMYNRLSERYKFFKVAKGTELYVFISDFVDRLYNFGLDVNEVELEENLGLCIIVGILHYIKMMIFM